MILGRFGISDGVVSSPWLVSVGTMLGWLRIEHAPRWAADLLVSGYDADALRRLAGVGAGDTYAIHDLLPTVLDELGVGTTATSAVDVATWIFDGAALRMLAGEITERWLVWLVGQVVIHFDFDWAATDSPLAQIYILDDEWSANWGRNETELKAVIRTTCIDQIREAERRTSRIQ